MPPRGAALPWLIPGSIPLDAAGCSHACRGRAFPSHPRGAPGAGPGSDPPDTAAFADMWCLLFVFGLVWEGSTLNSWSF